MHCVISYPQTRQFAFFTGLPEQVGREKLEDWIIVYGPADYASCQAAMSRFRPMIHPFNFTASRGWRSITVRRVSALPLTTSR